MYHIRAGFPETYNLCQVHQNYHIFKHAIPYEKNENRYRVFPNETFKNNVQISYSRSILCQSTSMDRLIPLSFYLKFLFSL